MSSRTPVSDTTEAPGPEHAVELYWLPLGAGAQVVRRCGRVYEAAVCPRITATAILGRVEVKDRLGRPGADARVRHCLRRLRVR